MITKIRKTKKCCNCSRRKAINYFHHNSKSPDGHQNQCKKCSADKHKVWTKSRPNYYQELKAKNPNRFRAIRLKASYGISIETYEQKLTEQQSLCAICKRPETRKLRGVVSPLSVDHNHITNTVRGLLCHQCNVGLGHLERPGWKAAALDYLDKYREIQ